jgi:hypothetical protein
MGISEDLKVALCPKPCKGPITRSQHQLMPDGSVEVSASAHRRSAMRVPSATTLKRRYATSRSCTVSLREEASGGSGISKTPFESRSCTATRQRQQGAAALPPNFGLAPGASRLRSRGAPVLALRATRIASTSREDLR